VPDGHGRTGRVYDDDRRCGAPAALTLDRYGHLYESDVEAVGVAVNRLLTSGFVAESGANCGRNVGTEAVDGSD